MSITDSMYGERWFHFDRSITKQLEREAAEKEYRGLVEDGEINEEEQSFEQWYESGNWTGNYY